MKKNTLIEQACCSYDEFSHIYYRMKRSIELSGKSLSTLTNYARCLATITLHLKGFVLQVPQIRSFPIN